eukprot:jgi/Botrbrau1/3844/Bobra.0183s0069.1
MDMLRAEDGPDAPGTEPDRCEAASHDGPMEINAPTTVNTGGDNCHARDEQMCTEVETISQADRAAVEVARVLAAAQLLVRDAEVLGSSPPDAQRRSEEGSFQAAVQVLDLPWASLSLEEARREADVRTPPIRKRFRELSMLLHPDKNPSPLAAKAFEACLQAQSCLLQLVEPDTRRSKQGRAGDPRFEDDEDRAGYCVCLEAVQPPESVLERFVPGEACSLWRDCDAPFLLLPIPRGLVITPSPGASAPGPPSGSGGPRGGLLQSPRGPRLLLRGRDMPEASSDGDLPQQFALLMPCRVAVRGCFPLNGTFFQPNEVFLDEATLLSPLQVEEGEARSWRRRKVHFGSSILPIALPMDANQIGRLYLEEFVCVRQFDFCTGWPSDLPDWFSKAPPPTRPRARIPPGQLRLTDSATGGRTKDSETDNASVPPTPTAQKSRKRKAKDIPATPPQPSPMPPQRGSTQTLIPPQRGSPQTVIPHQRRSPQTPETAASAVAGAACTPPCVGTLAGASEVFRTIAPPGAPRVPSDEAAMAVLHGEPPVPPDEAALALRRGALHVPPEEAAVAVLQGAQGVPLVDAALAVLHGAPWVLPVEAAMAGLQGEPCVPQIEAMAVPQGAPCGSAIEAGLAVLQGASSVPHNVAAMALLQGAATFVPPEGTAVAPPPGMHCVQPDNASVAAPPGTPWVPPRNGGAPGPKPKRVNHFPPIRKADKCGHCRECLNPSYKKPCSTRRRELLALMLRETDGRAAVQ